MDAQDPSGLLSVGVCGGLSAAAGFGDVLGVGGVASGCLTRVVSGGPDSIGVTGTAGVGPAAGLNIGASLSYQVSNATSLSDLSGMFQYITLSGEFGDGASATVFWGLNADHKLIYGAELGPAFGAGVQASTGVSNTYAHTFGGLTAMLARIAWDGANPVLATGQILQDACQVVANAT